MTVPSSNTTTAPYVPSALSTRPRPRARPPSASLGLGEHLHHVPAHRASGSRSDRQPAPAATAGGPWRSSRARRRRRRTCPGRTDQPPPAACAATPRRSSRPRARRRVRSRGGERRGEGADGVERLERRLRGSSRRHGDPLAAGPPRLVPGRIAREHVHEHAIARHHRRRERDVRVRFAQRFLDVPRPRRRRRGAPFAHARRRERRSRRDLGDESVQPRRARRSPGFGTATATMDTSYDPRRRRGVATRTCRRRAPQPRSRTVPGPQPRRRVVPRTPASRVWLPKRSRRVTRTTPGSPAGQCSISLPASTRHSVGSIGPATHVTGRTRTVGELREDDGHLQRRPPSRRRTKLVRAVAVIVDVAGTGSSPGTRASISGAPPRWMGFPLLSFATSLDHRAFARDAPLAPVALDDARRRTATSMPSARARRGVPATHAVEEDADGVVAGVEPPDRRDVVRHVLGEDARAAPLACRWAAGGAR